MRPLRSLLTDSSLSEYQQLQMRIEYLKVVGTIVSIFVPLGALAITAAVTVALAYSRERVDFELKASDIVMSSSSPIAACNKATVLVALFPDRLSSRFASTFSRLYPDTQCGVLQE